MKSKTRSAFNEAIIVANSNPLRLSHVAKSSTILPSGDLKTNLQTYLSLEDHVIRVQRPDGGIVCEHEDGTRITKYSALDSKGDDVITYLIKFS